MDIYQRMEKYGRYVVNRFISTSSKEKGNEILKTYFTKNKYNPADILYLYFDNRKYAVEVKVRNGIYPTYFYENAKDNRLLEYKKRGYTLIYANVIEDNGQMYIWDVTDLKKIKGVTTTTVPCFDSTFSDNPKLISKAVYELPVTSANITANVTEYINEYKELNNADN